MKIEKLLVANRGEIAVRIFKTCQELGISTVAVYSDADAEAIHVLLADESISLGPSEPAQSYLVVEKIIAAAKQTGAQAIHPGYGFLSERPQLAEACEANDIVFIGPSARSMRLLGDKISAKKLAVQAGVPIVPGYFEPDASISDLSEAALRVGFPVMLKAAAGGGGRGIRVVNSVEELETMAPMAAREALNAFGDGTMMVEKLILAPRHVEVQVLADQNGGVSTLFERECSVQRRNQKMLEEAPSPAVESGLVDWEKLKQAAIAVVAEAVYTNAGTVEFVVDSTTGEFYFLEVNTRIQVEHPVSELCTGIDLVAQQIRIAEGKPLSLPQAILEGDRVALCGHSFEARVLAEDPDRFFQPSLGKILAWSIEERPGVRIDTGFRAGSEVSPYYDSLLAKVIVHGETRVAAIAKLKRALESFHVLGVATNIAFLLELLSEAAFISGIATTAFLPEYLERRPVQRIPDELVTIMAMGATSSSSRADLRGKTIRSSWDAADGFRIGGL